MSICAQWRAIQHGLREQPVCGECWAASCACGYVFESTADARGRDALGRLVCHSPGCARRLDIGLELLAALCALAFLAGFVDAVVGGGGLIQIPALFVLLPGVIDSLTNFVEHPEVVANRICEAVDAVGDRSRVIASVDCGFGTFAGSQFVAEDVVWHKLKACREGAYIATKRLWGRAA